MDLYLIRHGESNIPDGMTETNFPLSILGKEQAKALSKRMARIRIDVLLSSALLRARETAEILGESQRIPVKLVDDFLETFLPGLAQVTEGLIKF